MFFTHRTVWLNRNQMARRAACAALVASALVAGALRAAPAPPDVPATQASQPSQPATRPTDDRLLARWFAELASSDASVREAARSRLMRLDRGELPRVEQLVRNARPLAPSQAAALRSIVQEIFLSGEPYQQDPVHGFLGIMMDESAFAARDLQQPNDAAQAPGVVVTDRFPGFSAARSLRDGDVILGTAEPAQPFNTPNDLKFAIAGLEPGSVIRLQVLRQGQVIEVPLTLGCKPADVDSIPAALEFKRERAEKFDQYWRETFAKALEESVG